MDITVDGVAVTVEDLARAWASIDGKREDFDREKASAEMVTGHYEGYLSEAEEQIRRAVEYAKVRKP